VESDEGVEDDRRGALVAVDELLSRGDPFGRDRRLHGQVCIRRTVLAVTG
jgi:hypothetical protein